MDINISTMLGISPITRLSQHGCQIEYRTASTQEIERWLARGIPVIAFVLTEFLEYWAAWEATRNAIVIVGIDDQNVYFNDPAFASALQISSRNGFLAA